MMSQTHIQIALSESMRADRLERAARYRLARSRRPGVGRRLRAVAMAFRRPELVTVPPRHASAPRGC